MNSSKSVAAVATFLVALSLGGCSGRLPTAPTPSTPQTPAAPAAQNVITRIQGEVDDTASRPLAGVRVEILDGAQAGAVAMTDTGGNFSFSGAFVGTLTFRATKDGYLIATQTLDLRGFSSIAAIYISLGPLAPPARIEAGDYTLTIIADSACTEIPIDLRTRTYAATITPVSTVPANTQYNVAVSGEFLRSRSFLIGVAGNYLGFADDMGFWEYLPAFTYIDISGAGGASVDTPTGSTISMPFTGGIDYCVLNSARGILNNCHTTPAEQVIARSECLSTNQRMILTRR